MHTCIPYDHDTNVTFSENHIPVRYLVYTRFRMGDSIYQAYTIYIPCQNFLGFPDAISALTKYILFIHHVKIFWGFQMRYRPYYRVCADIGISLYYTDIMIGAYPISPAAHRHTVTRYRVNPTRISSMRRYRSRYHDSDIMPISANTRYRVYGIPWPDIGAHPISGKHLVTISESGVRRYHDRASFKSKSAWEP